MLQVDSNDGGKRLEQWCTEYTSKIKTERKRGRRDGMGWDGMGWDSSFNLFAIGSTEEVSIKRRDNFSTTAELEDLRRPKRAQ